MVAVKPVGQRPAPHHVAHGKIHQHQQKAQRGNEPPLELGGLVVGQCVQIGAGAAGGSSAGLFGAGAVPGLLHRLNDGRVRGGALHAHGVGQQAHRAAGNAGYFFNGLFHPGRAGRTAHAGYIELFHRGSSLGAMPHRAAFGFLYRPGGGGFVSRGLYPTPWGVSLWTISVYFSVPALSSDYPPLCRVDFCGNLFLFYGIFFREFFNILYICCGRPLFRRARQGAFSPAGPLLGKVFIAHSFL